MTTPSRADYPVEAGRPSLKWGRKISESLAGARLTSPDHMISEGPGGTCIKHKRRSPVAEVPTNYWQLSASPTAGQVMLTCAETAIFCDAITGRFHDMTGTNVSAAVTGTRDFPDIVYARSPAPGAIDLFLAPITNVVDVVMAAATGGVWSYYPLGIVYKGASDAVHILSEFPAYRVLSRPLSNMPRITNLFAAVRLQDDQDGIYLPARDVYTPGGTKTVAATTLTITTDVYVWLEWNKSADTVAYGAGARPANDGVHKIVARCAYESSGGGSDGNAAQAHVEWTSPEDDIRFTADIPSGGSTLQFLQKASATNWALQWGHPLPTGGATGKVLKKTSGTDFDVYWGDDA